MIMKAFGQNEKGESPEKAARLQHLYLLLPCRGGDITSEIDRIKAPRMRLISVARGSQKETTYEILITRLGLRLASFFLGIISFSIPCSQRALIFSFSTVSGRWKERLKDW